MHSSSNPKEMLTLMLRMPPEISRKEASSTYSKSVRIGWRCRIVRLSSRTSAFSARPSV